MITQKEITKQELINMLQNWNFGAQPVSIQYLTTPKINKEGKALFGMITKLANVGGLIGYNYQNAVNTQLERENKTANFNSNSIWNGKGKRINSTLVKHIEKGSLYLSYKHQQTFKCFFFDQFLNPVKNEVINNYFYNNSYNSQGTETKIEHREISIDSIKKIKLKKITYIIKG